MCRLRHDEPVLTPIPDPDLHLDPSVLEMERLDVHGLQVQDAQVQALAAGG